MGLDMYLYVTKYMSKFSKEGDKTKLEKIRKIFADIPKSENLESVEVKLDWLLEKSKSNP